MEKNETGCTTVQEDNLVKPIRIEEFQAFYHWMNAKPDSEVKIFPNNRRYRFADIKELDSKIVEKFHLHNIISASRNISIFLSDKRVIEFGNWEKFAKNDFAISSETNSISIIWDFYVKLPHYQLPQRHTIKLRIGSGLKPSEFLRLMWEGDNELEFQEAGSHLVCKIDFINPIICNEVFSLITEWHNTLPNNLLQNNFYKYLKRYKRYIRASITLLSLIAGALIIAPLIVSLKNNLSIFKDTNLYSIIELSSVYFIFMYITLLLGRFLSYRTSDMIDNITPIYLFELTKGDENKIESSNVKNKSLKRKILFEFILLILGNIFAFFFGELLKIFKFL